MQFRGFGSNNAAGNRKRIRGVEFISEFPMLVPLSFKLPTGGYVHGEMANGVVPVRDGLTMRTTMSPSAAG
ncbi:unnamed protein product [Linum trigynum]|uniref:Uncharacterized protein n=1 Tax=Linum trigynum TaxID=586398 RepID=A0AAV2FBE3_9ROSI